MAVSQETMRKLKEDFEASGCDMVIDVSHKVGVRNFMNISDLYRDHKHKLSVLNKGIERCKEEVKQREVEDLLDGDLYEKKKDRNIMWLEKMTSIKNFLSVLIILLKNILNFKINLLNNNLELLREYRNESKSHFLANYFISIIESLVQFNYSSFNSILNALNGLPELL